MNETGKQLLTVLDRALAPTPREQLVADGRALLARIRNRFGDTVAGQFTPRILFSQSTQERARTMLDGAPPKVTTPKPAAEVPPLLPPKPAPARIETAVLHRLLFHSVKTHLPADYCSLDERQQRRALLTAAWRSHCETALPTSLGPEVEAATAGLRRRELTGSVRTEAAFRKETITKSLKKARITTK
jgi:hypothetical protein